ncbi:uncharacterized protein LOC125500311 [Athalia rosae]|uniref:uncharacterized protein LOC125500311 n=1 Tax=Athalia rosae TaxID=37344 RepID=UPI002033C10C|nr:uncharacterized protein LOC125500311 [Athalia rosae]
MDISFSGTWLRIAKEMDSRMFSVEFVDLKPLLLRQYRIARLPPELLSVSCHRTLESQCGETVVNSAITPSHSCVPNMHTRVYDRHTYSPSSPSTVRRSSVPSSREGVQHLRYIKR